MTSRSPPLSHANLCCTLQLASSVTFLLRCAHQSDMLAGNESDYLQWSCMHGLSREVERARESADRSDDSNNDGDHVREQDESAGR